MNTQTDFDYQPHRALAAAAALQKGVYHLFILRSDKHTDLYEQVLRSYQCVFQLSLTLLLLDEAFSLNHLLKPNPLKPNRLPPLLGPCALTGRIRGVMKSIRRPWLHTLIYATKGAVFP
jgi:hypothetical protein